MSTAAPTSTTSWSTPATALSFLPEIPNAVWWTLGIVLLPLFVIFGALLIKILWGFWPVPAAIAAGGWGVWTMGIDWFWLIAVAIIAGLLGTWGWQRTALFLRFDRMLEKGMMLGD